uniref:Right handed beta helix domain-containing protein n=1 Tax=Zooxanthella nutricula TaxID=1333877 RepID=A0A6U6W0K9_9DINO
MAEPTRSPDWGTQTLFLATRGATDYSMHYCHAKDMVKTRVGFVLSSDVAVRDVSYQGIDTIRPNDNGALCGGAVFETKGCAENDCKVSDVNTGGSDGIGSVNVTVENVRLNDYYYAEDAFKVGYAVPGNYDCRTGNFSAECCFCLPNGVRSSQVGFWTPETRNPEGTRNVVVRNMVASSTQADGINLHGRVVGAVVEGAYFQNAGDDTYAVWGGASDPEDIVFRDCVAVNPGVLRPNWYGNCVATYGLKSVTFKGLTCRAPTLEHPIPSPDGGGVQIGLSMFVFQNSFWATYAKNNSIRIEGWKFETLAGAPYTASDGSMNKPEPQKFAWTRSENRVVAPYYVTSTEQVLHVVAVQ